MVTAEDIQLRRYCNEPETFMKAWGIIVAGGVGKRMGSAKPKQLLSLDGKTILERTLNPFTECTAIDGIVVVAPENSIDGIAAIIRRMPGLSGRHHIVAGGRERQDSVKNGLDALPSDTDIVVIHDAVRPFIRSTLINACIDMASRHGAMSVMRPVKETVKIVDKGVVLKTPERSTLWITQTPQAFRTELILEAHDRAREDSFTATDDCMLVERLGYSVHILEGDDLNIKITTPADLRIAEAVLPLFENGGKSC